MSNNSIQLELKELILLSLMYLIYYGEQSGELKWEFVCKIDQLFGHEVKSSQVNHRKNTRGKTAEINESLLWI